MANILALMVIVAMGYLIMGVISRKKEELADKELRHQEQFLKETQSLLKPQLPTFDTNYRTAVIEYLTAQGYKLSEHARTHGIDLIGLKEKELLLVRCENEMKEIKVVDLKLFIADCTVYIDHNPMLGGRSSVRLYATNRPITEEGHAYARENPDSVRLLEEV